MTGNLSLTSASDAAEIQAGAMVAVGGDLSLSGLSCQIAGLADVDVTGTATLAAAGSASASDADVLSGASLTAADVSQTADTRRCSPAAPPSTPPATSKSTRRPASSPAR